MLTSHHSLPLCIAYSRTFHCVAKCMWLKRMADDEEDDDEENDMYSISLQAMDGRYTWGRVIRNFSDDHFVLTMT